MVNKNASKIAEELDWRIRVFESLSYPTLILKPNKTVLNANEIFFEKYNTNAQNLKNKKCFQLFYDKNTPCLTNECPLEKVIKDKKGHTFLKRIETGKTYKWEDRVFSPILDDNGEVAYIIESIRDVTRVKSLEYELSGIKEFVERVVQSSASAIIAADRDGDIILMNRAAKDLFGFPRHQIVKHINAEQIYPKGQAKEIMKMLRDPKIGGKGKLRSTKINILNSAGEEVPVEITAAIIYDDENNEAATMGIYNDLREKIAVEQQLKEAQVQLAQSEKMSSLGQLAAGVAHEINNPLTGILFSANFILERLKDDDSIKKDIEYIVEDAKRCRDIVKSLLAYSRQTASRKNIIQLNELVEHSMMLIRDQKLFGNIAVQRNMSEEMILINVDTNQLSQVIINLVMNAADAMKGKGTLTLHTYRDKVNKKAFLEIQDTGCGIPKQNLNKIFDPFFTTKKLGKGTGLGLSTAYGIIQENGGHIEVRDTGKDGTTFLIELPLYNPEEFQSPQLEQTTIEQDLIKNKNGLRDV